MGIEIQQITTCRDKKEFIYLPTRIHRKHSMWVPPLYCDEWRFLNPKKNLSYRYCDAILALARRNGNVVGRIMGIINNSYNEQWNENTAIFGCLECYNDKGIAHRLLSFVENWAREHSMKRIVGPMGFTDQDPQGFLIEGFEHEPSLTTHYNFEYLIPFMEIEGYSKSVDYVVYKVPVPSVIPQFYEKIITRVIQRGTYSLINFTRKHELKPYIRPTLQLMNDTFLGLTGFIPLDKKEIDSLAGRYLPIIDPRFVKIVMFKSQIVGFIIGVPNMNNALRKANGHLLPMGWYWIYKSRRNSPRLDLLLGGIHEDHRGRGVDVLLGRAMLRVAREAGFSYIDTHHELESNRRVRSEMERLGGSVYKRYRIYKKEL